MDATAPGRCRCCASATGDQRDSQPVRKPAPLMSAAAAVRYTVTAANPQAHQFQVVCELDGGSDQIFGVASWSPGSYLLREYARHVVKVEASGIAGPVAVNKLDKSRWQCANTPGPLTIVLTIFAFDLSVRGAYLDPQRAFFNGPCVFPRFEGVQGPFDVVIAPPCHGGGADWRVATAMAPLQVNERGFGRYRCADYDELVDHPVEIADLVQFHFTAAGVPHFFALTGRQDGDLERLAADVRQICEAQIAFFGPPAPMSRYGFLGLVVSEGYGGLEHRASCSLIFSRGDLPRPGAQGMSKPYQRLLGLISHEYFHTWHIKRIKPAAFVPFRYHERNYTRLLWVFEGITTYYQDLFLLRGQVLAAGAYLDRLAEILTRVYRVPGRHLHSVADASFEAWDKLYKPTENTPNGAVSYYSKGAMVALALDLTLRLETNGRVSLDTVMSQLWQRYGLTEAGLPEDGFEALAAEISGLNLEDFFARYVRGTQDPALASLLDHFGVSLTLRARHGDSDNGGIAPASDPPTVSLGIQSVRNNPLTVAVVLAESVGERAGLAPGDQLVALDGLKLTERNLASRLAEYQPGDAARLAVFRRDELLELPIILEQPPQDTASLELVENADSVVRARREAWLGC
jgi:predicted metalloprotease with PDZ domain